MAGSGLYTAALSSGGESPTTGKTESWNGTNWTELNDMNSARRSLAGAGTNIATLVFGGNTTTVVALTEEWNGVSWAEVADLNTARSSAGAGGTTTNGLAFGGETPPVTAATEEWNVPSNLTKTVDTD